jgi:transcriptional regulator of acetoin/glycerol metabolism
MAATAQAGPEPVRDGAAHDSPAGPQKSMVIPLAEMEKQAIIHALEYTKGDRVMASHLLGIGRTTLYRKLKEYGLA